MQPVSCTCQYRFKIRHLTTNMSLLTLDQTTLFYWNLSNEYRKPKFSGTNDVASWTAGIPKGTKPSIERTNTTPSLSNSRSNGSRATSATRPPSSVVSRASALSNGIQISGADTDNLMENGAISDRDETQGEEYEAKKKSPIKGGTRLTSTVSIINRLLLMCTDCKSCLAYSES